MENPLSLLPYMKPRILDPEEIPMTFQIGFTASDGVLIGSDRKKTSLFGYHHSQNIPKIQINESETFAYCSAGDSGFGDVVASVVEEELSKGTVDFVTGDAVKAQRMLRHCLHTARERESEYIKSRGLQPSGGANIMFVFRQNEAVALWTMDALSQVPAVSLVIEGENIKAGDANSPSVFFPHWYFDKVRNTVESLLPLAVHTVLMAKADHIDGVQIGIFTSTQFRTMTDEELNPYIRLSQEIDSRILALLQRGKDVSL
jgi:hypothetical protein